MLIKLAILLILPFIQQPKIVDCKLIHMADVLTVACNNSRNSRYEASYADWPEQWDAPYVGLSYKAVETPEGLFPIAFTKEEIRKREAQREAEYARARAIIEGTFYKRKPLQNPNPERRKN